MVLQQFKYNLIEIHLLQFENVAKSNLLKKLSNEIISASLIFIELQALERRYSNSLFNSSILKKIKEIKENQRVD